MVGGAGAEARGGRASRWEDIPELWKGLQRSECVWQRMSWRIWQTMSGSPRVIHMPWAWFRTRLMALCGVGVGGCKRLYLIDLPDMLGDGKKYSSQTTTNGTTIYAYIGVVPGGSMYAYMAVPCPRLPTPLKRWQLCRRSNSESNPFEHSNKCHASSNRCLTSSNNVCYWEQVPYY